MANIKLPKGYSPDFQSPKVKPKGEVAIDWDNPLAKGITFLSGAGSADVVEGVRQSPTLSTDVTLRGNDHVFRTQSDTTATGVNYGNVHNYPAGGMTVTTIIMSTDYDSTFQSATDVQGFISKSKALSFDGKWLIEVYQGDVYALAQGASGLKTIQVPHAGILTDGKPTILTWVTQAGNNTLTDYLYADGKEIGTSSANSGVVGTSSETLKIGAYDENLSNVWAGTLDGVHYLSVIHDRLFSPAEVKSLHANPYQILKPKQSLQLVTASTGASITSVGGDDVVLDAEVNAAFVTSGFSSEISTVQLVSGTSITNCTDITSTGGAGTFDIIDVSTLVVSTVGCPFSSASNVVVARLTDA